VTTGQNPNTHATEGHATGQNPSTYTPSELGGGQPRGVPESPRRFLGQVSAEKVFLYDSETEHKTKVAPPISESPRRFLAEINTENVVMHDTPVRGANEHEYGHARNVHVRGSSDEDRGRKLSSCVRTRGKRSANTSGSEGGANSSGSEGGANSSGSEGGANSSGSEGGTDESTSGEMVEETDNDNDESVEESSREMSAFGQDSE
jgi:hypothetical protein